MSLQLDKLLNERDARAKERFNGLFKSLSEKYLSGINVTVDSNWAPPCQESPKRGIPLDSLASSDFPWNEQQPIQRSTTVKRGLECLEEENLFSGFSLQSLKSAEVDDNVKNISKKEIPKLKQCFVRLNKDEVKNLLNGVEKLCGNGDVDSWRLKNFPRGPQEPESESSNGPASKVLVISKKPPVLPKSSNITQKSLLTVHENTSCKKNAVHIEDQKDYKNSSINSISEPFEENIIASAAGNFDRTTEKSTPLISTVEENPSNFDHTKKPDDFETALKCVGNIEEDKENIVKVGNYIEFNEIVGSEIGYDVETETDAESLDDLLTGKVTNNLGIETAEKWVRLLDKLLPVEEVANEHTDDCAVETYKNSSPKLLLANKDNTENTQVSNESMLVNLAKDSSSSKHINKYDGYETDVESDSEENSFATKSIDHQSDHQADDESKDISLHDLLVGKVQTDIIKTAGKQLRTYLKKLPAIDKKTAIVNRRKSTPAESECSLQTLQPKSSLPSGIGASSGFSEEEIVCGRESNNSAQKGKFKTFRSFSLSKSYLSQSAPKESNFSPSARAKVKKLSWRPKCFALPTDSSDDGNIEQIKSQNTSPSKLQVHDDKPATESDSTQPTKKKPKESFSRNRKRSSIDVKANKFIPKQKICFNSSDSDWNEEMMSPKSEKDRRKSQTPSSKLAESRKTVKLAENHKSLKIGKSENCFK
ncbi:uncharacterized protein LOC132203036 isoform X2 [Neocloeon triangulifer]|uniref:uncharacterized protein LOC132203036 isoform X2 n=1 Tax=Neocloeon triangulifer TaxID=2078957 RepID=UPI00286F87CB|nr:uncharacterized protein LOC132203036 isoform X2 [Neocloeon triangulifer]